MLSKPSEIKMNDKRNVIDYYKYWTTDAIKADLDLKRHDFSVVVYNEINDFNLGAVIRNANAFLAKEVIIYGRKAYDRRSTVGTHLYENLKHVKPQEALSFPEGTTIVGIDNIEGAVPLETFKWPQGPVAMLFGQEQIGLTPELIKMCHHICYIKQHGSVRSINVGCASSIAMYDWCQKNIGN